MSARFGPAGNSDSFSRVHRSSLAAPSWIAGRGLDCYEYQCGKGVHVGEDTARKVGENAVEAGISLDEVRAELAGRHVIDHKVKQEKMASDQAE